ncbi:MAG: hypothetical protein ACREVY_18160, partial [Gammaproteobacteria bacterium]
MRVGADQDFSGGDGGSRVPARRAAEADAQAAALNAEADLSGVHAGALDEMFSQERRNSARPAGSGPGLVTRSTATRPNSNQDGFLLEYINEQARYFQAV